MTGEGIREILSRGEGMEAEFKEALFQLPKTTFETICAFLNRNGGHLLLGVKNDGTVEGVLESEAEKMKNEIVNSANSLPKLNPQFYLAPQIINYKGNTIIYVYVPESSQVHNSAGKIFDRNATDGDIDITAIQHQVTQLYVRKQQTYSENRIYPAVRLSDFRKDLLQRVRTMAGNQRANHPWINMDDKELLQSSGLYQKNYSTGNEGYTMAAALLLAKDDVIQSILPHYKTDAILRIENIDRYDDRDDVRTNLIESYDRLMAFIAKHLPDKFYQEGTQRISLRDRIFREIVANILVHREFTNAFPAKLIIEKNDVTTENWSRPHGSGLINPALFSPFPKNPVIARFFKEIGWVEELGSGVRNTFKYVSVYSGGKNPVFEEGDVFKCMIPLDGALRIGNAQQEEINEIETDGRYVSDRTTLYFGRELSAAANQSINDGVNDGVIDGVSDGVRNELLKLVITIATTPGQSAMELTRAIGKTKPTIERYLRTLRKLNVTEFKGAPKSGGYYLTKSFGEKLNKK